MRYAVASRSGYLIDQHFGHARRFYIYEDNSKSIVLMDERTVVPYCSNDDDFSRDNIFAAFHDCVYVLALRFGSGAIRKIKMMNKIPVEAYGETKLIINHILKGINENQSYRYL